MLTSAHMRVHLENLCPGKAVTLLLDFGDLKWVYKVFGSFIVHLAKELVSQELQ